MPLSAKTRTRLCAPFAISSITRFAALPFIIGLLMIGTGYLQQADWLKAIGFVLTLPVLWVYFVIAFIFPLYVLFDKNRKR